MNKSRIRATIVSEICLVSSSMARARLSVASVVSKILRCSVSSALAAASAVAFVALGSVVLCVTGAEALYADMGHFGKQPIRLAWFSAVMPALVLNYFGQGAMLLADPSKVANPFFEMAPSWALYPLIALATLATVIASQALITAAFSVTKQVIQLEIGRAHV